MIFWKHEDHDGPIFTKLYCLNFTKGIIQWNHFELDLKRIFKIIREISPGYKPGLSHLGLLSRPFFPHLLLSSLAFSLACIFPPIGSESQGTLLWMCTLATSLLSKLLQLESGNIYQEHTRESWCKASMSPEKTAFIYLCILDFP